MYHIIVLAFITLKSIELVAKNKQTFESGSKNFNLSLLQKDTNCGQQSNWSKNCVQESSKLKKNYKDGHKGFVMFISLFQWKKLIFLNISRGDLS